MGVKRKRKGRLSYLLALGLCLGFALVLAALLYGTMVYQLTDETQPEGLLAAAYMPGFPKGMLALGDAELTEEWTNTVLMGGVRCTEVTRRYALADGTQALTISATPAAYMERLVQEGWQTQLITGFVVANLDALYALKDDQAMLVTRSGDAVYMVISPQIGEQAAYALGATAYLDGAY